MAPGLLLALSCLPACSRDARERAPIPASMLRPVRAELEAIARAAAASRPASADSRQQAEVADLLVTAYGGSAGGRAAKTAEASLADFAPAALVPALESMLADDHAGVRGQCAWRLGRLGSRASILPLLLRLKYEKDAEPRLWVADALARLGNDTALPELVAAMRKDDLAQTAGALAFEILKSRGTDPGQQPSYARLAEGLASTHAHWLAEGAVAGDPAPDGALVARIAQTLLLLDGSQLRQVDDARYVVQRCGRASLGPLRLALQSDETYLRNHALEITRDLGRPGRELERTVLPLLGDRMSAPYAAAALGATCARTAAPLLLAARQRGDTELRAAIAQALGPCGDPASVPALEAWLADARCPLDERVGAAFSLELLKPGAGGRAFLEQRLAARDYHEPTLRELLGKLPR